MEIAIAKNHINLVYIESLNIYYLIRYIPTYMYSVFKVHLNKALLYRLQNQNYRYLRFIADVC